MKIYDRTHGVNLRISTSAKPSLIRTNAATAAKLVLGLTLLALLPLSPRASASSFFFSTGSPDGLIGTLSRPASAGLVQTETADDFVLNECVLINQATFTGLLPMGAPLSSINRVEIEIYHVFPVDSDTSRTPAVVTRTNSPSDVEIGGATRDSLDGSLSAMATVVIPTFSVLNSVVNGINKSPNQFTGGEGSVTGTEVTITVTFDPPIFLPADHYFFRPEVGLSSGNFLWLSAPKPIVPPGTPFVPDLQSWIRNDNLAPDWSRIGTDITGQGPFNASFSLSGVTDAESIINELVPCSGPASGGTWKNHGQYVSSVAHAAQSLANQGCISQQEIGQIVSEAAQSDCGKEPKNRAAVADFNGDGHPDWVVRNAETRQTAIWYLNNNAFISGAYGPTLAPGWGLRSVADFNRSTHPDYALFNPVTVQTAIWYLSGPTLIGSAYGPTLPSGWELVAAADFNGGGNRDYVLYKPSTGQTAIWYLNNNVWIGSAYGPTLPPGWSLMATADFNGDGKPDYVLYNANTRQTAIWYMNNNVFAGSAWGPMLPPGWQLVATADFNGDGKPDYVLYNANTRQTAIWYMNNNVYVSGAYGPTLPAGWSFGP
jgi:FG-GAP-like repeat